MQGANPGLKDAARAWPTANARDEKGIDQHSHEGADGNCLPNSVVNWATATTKTGGPDGERVRNGEGGMADLKQQAATFPSSPLAGATPTTPIIPTGGLGLLLRRWTPPSSRALNPRFQFWLMGFPLGLLTCSELAATALSPSAPPSPSPCCFGDWFRRSSALVGSLLEAGDE
jgi:hypothetical protein